MIVVPSGAFLIGSPADEPGRTEREGPQRLVTIRRFAAGRFPVTRGEWGAFVAATGRKPHPGCAWTGRRRGGETDRNGAWNSLGFAQDDSHPVVCVSWQDGRAYARWLSSRTGRAYRLLTEAEWEYAARSGTTTAYPWGAVASRDHANYGADACCAGATEGHDRWTETSPVAAFPPNAFGLHDMHGNALEWVQDCFASSYLGHPVDGSAYQTVVTLKMEGRFAYMNGTSSCDFRMLRGGDWGNPPRLIRSASRNFGPPAGASLTDYRSGGAGFRVGRDLR